MANSLVLLASRTHWKVEIALSSSLEAGIAGFPTQRHNDMDISSWERSLGLSDRYPDYKWGPLKPSLALVGVRGRIKSMKSSLDDVAGLIIGGPVYSRYCRVEKQKKDF